MLIPTNAVASTIVQLTSVNADIDQQIADLNAAKARNAAMIEALSDSATWESAPE